MKVFKEIMVSIVVLIVILLTMGILLYDKAPTLKKIPKAQEYTKSLEADKVLEEFVNQEETKTAIKTYKMNRAEINALSGNRGFEKGKSNPFADYSEAPSGNTGGNTSNNNSGTGGKIFDDPGKGASK